MGDQAQHLRIMSLEERINKLYQFMETLGQSTKIGNIAGLNRQLNDCLDELATLKNQ